MFLGSRRFSGKPHHCDQGGRWRQGRDQRHHIKGEPQPKKRRNTPSSQSSSATYVGGAMSHETEISRNPGSKSMDPTLFSRCQFFDLPDYFTHKCTNNNTRSFCSTTRKCSFYLTREAGGIPHGHRSRRIDRRRLMETDRSSKRTNSGCGDTSWQGAHAKRLLRSWISKKAPLFGMVSTTRYVEKGVVRPSLSQRAPPLTSHRSFEQALVTSSRAAEGYSSRAFGVLTLRGSPLTRCTCYPDSVYKDATFPNWWMNEGGQCSKGRLIDFIITTHAVYSELKERAKQENKNIQVCCNRSRRTYTSIQASMAC
ncbi:hypothetical protein EDD17DRAFT_1634433 [Pisolithus thermaeus]|nr:hypothetical protein EDD17DRAFT_1634433 [Pisolithus thermaeus]